MANLFLKILEMSIAGTACILVVLALRALLRRAPKIFSYMLWAVVFLRLICPFSLRSSHFGLTRGDVAGMLEAAAYEQELVEYQVLVHKDGRVETSARYGRLETSGAETEDMEEAFSAFDTDKDNVVGKSPYQISVNNLQNNMIGSRYSHSAVQRQERSWLVIGSLIWAAGVSMLLGYSVVSYLLLHRQLRQAVRIQADVYESDRISTPFLLGFLDSRIYLPMGLEQEEKAYVLAHELVHLQRRDYLVKTVTWLILALHWFNPLVWLAYRLMAKDMEMSCDEKVIRRLGESNKKTYSQTLLAISGAASGRMVRRILPATPLSFGERDIHSRVKNILAYRSVKTGTAALLVLLLAVAGIMLMTDWQEPSPEGGKVGKRQGGEPPAGAEQTPGEPETDNAVIPEEDLSNGKGEQADYDDEEKRIRQLRALCEMDRGSGMTWEQLQILAQETWPDLEDYAGYEGAVWPDEAELEGEDGGLTLSLIYLLYDADTDQEYRLDVQFNKKDLALNSVYLYRESDRDVLTIYREPEGQGTYHNAEIASFRQNICGLGDWVSSWELPHEEMVQISPYQVDRSFGSGVLFIWEGEERELEDSWAWKQAGGFGRQERAEQTDAPFVFDSDGQLTDLRFYWNHSLPNGSSEKLEGCQEQAVLLSMNHDLYTAGELYEREEAGDPITEEDTTADYWYIGFAREDAPYAYVLVLAERYFTREEAIAMARSIRFTTKAWEAE